MRGGIAVFRRFFQPLPALRVVFANALAVQVENGEDKLSLGVVMRSSLWQGLRGRSEPLLRSSRVFFDAVAALVGTAEQVLADAVARFRCFPDMGEGGCVVFTAKFAGKLHLPQAGFGAGIASGGESVVKRAGLCVIRLVARVGGLLQGGAVICVQGGSEDQGGGEKEGANGHGDFRILWLGGHCRMGKRIGRRTRDKEKPPQAVVFPAGFNPSAA